MEGRRERWCLAELGSQGSQAGFCIPPLEAAISKGQEGPLPGGPSRLQRQELMLSKGPRNLPAPGKLPPPTLVPTASRSITLHLLSQGPNSLCAQEEANPHWVM